MRQRLGQHKLRKYAEATGLDVIAGTARGNTSHRVDLRTSNGEIWNYWPRTGQLEKRGDGFDPVYKANSRLTREAFEEVARQITNGEDGHG